MKLQPIVQIARSGVFETVQIQFERICGNTFCYLQSHIPVGTSSFLGLNFCAILDASHTHQKHCHQNGGKRKNTHHFSLLSILMLRNAKFSAQGSSLFFVSHQISYLSESTPWHSLNLLDAASSSCHGSIRFKSCPPETIRRSESEMIRDCFFLHSPLHSVIAEHLMQRIYNSSCSTLHVVRI